MGFGNAFLNLIPNQMHRVYYMLTYKQKKCSYEKNEPTK